MQALLIGLVVWLLGSMILRVMAGAGLAFLTYKVSTSFIDGIISDVNTNLSGVPADITAIMSILGVGEAMSIMLGTGVAIISVVTGARIAGIKLAGG